MSTRQSPAPPPARGKSTVRPGMPRYGSRQGSLHARDKHRAIPATAAPPLPGADRTRAPRRWPEGGPKPEAKSPQASPATNPNSAGKIPPDAAPRHAPAPHHRRSQAPPCPARRVARYEPGGAPSRLPAPIPPAPPPDGCGHKPVCGSTDRRPKPGPRPGVSPAGGFRKRIAAGE